MNAASRLRVLFVCSGVALTLAALAWRRDFGAEGYWIPWKALLLCSLCFAPAARYAWMRASGHGDAIPSVPFVTILAAIHGLYFGVPVLLSDTVSALWMQPRAAALESALDLSLLGVGCFLAGSALARALGLGGPGLRAGWSRDRALGAALALVPIGIGASLALRAGLVPDTFVQPAKLLSLGLPFAVGILVLLSRTGELPRGVRLLSLGVALPTLVALELSEGQIGSAVRLGAFFLALLWGTGARIPFSLIAVGALGALFLRGGAMEYRDLANNHPHLLPESRLERSAVFARIVVEGLRRDGGGAQAAAVVDRISQIALFAHVAERTPVAVPYWSGRSYATLPAAVIPRALWPDKPVNQLGQDFGHRYGILDGADRSTSINLPWLVEFFVNFGSVGVALGMALLGCLWSCVERACFGRTAGLGAVLFGAVVVGVATNVESDLSQVLGSCLQQAIVLAPLLAWCAARYGVRGGARVDGARA